jgi:hypothetical protein
MQKHVFVRDFHETELIIILETFHPTQVTIKFHQRDLNSSETLP